jgi:hypothetical protein
MIKGGLFRPREGLKYEVLSAFSNSGLELTIAHDDPRANGVPGSWEPLGGDWWRIPTGVDWKEPGIAAWLALGGWFLATAPIRGDRPDLIRSKPSRIVEALEEAGVDAAIEAFHDNNPWVVTCLAS